jgi:uncharacterized protein YecE (DUF72 family)
MNIFVGTAGFSYKDWEGIVYPRDLKKQKIHPLEYLAQFYDCCEINTSFYGPLRPATGKNWCEIVKKVNPDFLFTAKLYKAFTHSPVAVLESTSAETLKWTDEDETLTHEGLDSVAAEGKLGAVLAQFPISFKNTEDNRGYLRKLLDRFHQYPLAVEVRHASWNESDVVEEFTARGVGFVNIDQPMLGKAIRGTAYTTSMIGYVRLHGRNYKQWFESERALDRYNYLYTPAQLEPWKERIKYISKHTEKTFVIANNHPKGKAAANATELKSMLSGRKVKAPENLREHYPELIEFAA